MSLFIKDKIYRQYQTNESCKMIPMQRFSFKQYGSEYCKDDKRHYFLDNLKLHQRKRTAIAYEPDAIGRNLK